MVGTNRGTRLKAILGYDASPSRQGQPVVWDTDKLANPHIAISGISGSGKTHTIRNMIAAMSQTAARPPRFHLFDVHGDMGIQGASDAMFSAQTPYGLNPLRILDDMHYGGVRNRVMNFMSIINRVSPSALGVRQESVISKMLYDLYKSHGFDPKDASTWKIDEEKSMLVNGGADNRLYLDVPIAEKDDVKALGGRWDPEKKLWFVAADQYKGSITKWLPKTLGRTNPTVEELLHYAERLMKAAFMGTDQKAVLLLEIYHRAASGYQRKVLDMARRGAGEWQDKDMLDALEKAREKVEVAMKNYLLAVRTGAELNHALDYGSLEVMKSVVVRRQIFLP